MFRSYFTLSLKNFTWKYFLYYFIRVVKLNICILALNILKYEYNASTKVNKKLESRKRTLLLFLIQEIYSTTCLLSTLTIQKLNGISLSLAQFYFCAKRKLDFTFHWKVIKVEICSRKSTISPFRNNFALIVDLFEYIYVGERTCV